MLRDLLWLRSPRHAGKYLRRAAAAAEAHDADAGAPPILILQQGKVGSISVLDALRGAGRRWVVQLHHANEAAVRWMREAADDGFGLTGVPGRSPEALDWATERIARVRYGSYLLRNADRYAPRVIVLVRDPVARSLSLCYHALRPMVEALPEGEGVRRLLDAYERHFWLWADATPWEVPAFFGRGRFDGSHPSWYQRELNAALGMDLLARRPNLRAGFAIDSIGPTQVLLLRTERLSEVLGDALRAFLGIEITVVRRSNASAGALYDDFTRAVSIPSVQLDRLLAAPTIQALYDDRERESIRKRWVS